jgi:hypothetical protein
MLLEASMMQKAFKYPLVCRMLLKARMLQEPGSLWIVKPPGRNNGSGIR